MSFIPFVNPVELIDLGASDDLCDLVEMSANVHSQSSSSFTDEAVQRKIDNLDDSDDLSDLSYLHISEKLNTLSDLPNVNTLGSHNNINTLSTLPNVNTLESVPDVNTLSTLPNVNTLGNLFQSVKESKLDTSPITDELQNVDSLSDKTKKAYLTSIADVRNYLDLDTRHFSPMIQEYWAIRRQYRNCIVLYHVGTFYETYFDDALLLGEKLKIERTWIYAGNSFRAARAGIPVTALSSHLGQLMHMGYKVAICSELAERKDTKQGDLVKRGVVRVVTGSTYIDDESLEGNVSNYLCVICKSNGIYGLSFSDISTGEIFVTELTSERGVLNELARYRPIEVLYSKANDVLFHNLIENRIKLNCMFSVDSTLFEDVEQVELSQGTITSVTREIQCKYPNVSMYDLGLLGKLSGMCSLSVLLRYVDYTQCSNVNVDMLPVFYTGTEYMGIDVDTRRNLELTENLYGKVDTGSLYSVLNVTKTPMGSRLLKQWLDRPLLSQHSIEERLSSVGELMHNGKTRSTIRSCFSSIQDIQRLHRKVELNNFRPTDFIKLRNSFSVLPQLLELMCECSSSLLHTLTLGVDTLSDLYELFSVSLSDNAPSNVHDGGVIKRGYNAELDSYRDLVSNSTSYITKLEESERIKTGIKNLKIVHGTTGYLIDITKSNLQNPALSRYTFVRQLKCSSRYTMPELLQLESDLLCSADKSLALEGILYSEIRNQYLSASSRILNTCNSISQLDVLCSFAELSYTHNYCRPSFNVLGLTSIKGGRHPIVECSSLTEPFISNDCEMDFEDNRVILLTGSNMSGKSTYMRQVALIQVMGQVGCFVPSQSANLSIVDQLFSRIGASDDISSGRSTFMVEMDEVRNIVLNATQHSLVILDEVGRGTSMYDGMVLAESTVEYLHSVIGCKTLFATHYHELVDMSKRMRGIQNYHMSVSRIGGHLVFLRKLIKGAGLSSYGIDVAEMAGLPPTLISRARELLEYHGYSTSVDGIE